MVILATASLVVFAAAVGVEGTTSCPRPAQVAVRLAELLPDVVGGGGGSGSGSVVADRARIREDGIHVAVLLESPDGTLIGERSFPRTFGCDDLASAMAVSLAGWESEVHPEFAPDLLGRAPVPEVAPAPVPALVPAPTLVRSAASMPLPFRPWGANAGLALGLGGSLDAPGPAKEALLSVWLTPPTWRTSTRIEIGGQSEQQVTFQYGRAVWRRWTLGLGFEREIPTGRAAAAAAANNNNDNNNGWLHWFVLARLAWLDMRGEGFAFNRTDSAFDPGMAAGLRATIARGRWSPFIELGASWWPVRHDVEAGGVGDIGRLPAAEAFARVGLGMISSR